MNTLQISLFALIIAQILKIFSQYPPDIKRITGSGGFPSSHAAFVSSLTSTIGLHHGINSDIFSVTAVFALIVIYDASGVRRAVGQQANILNNILTHFDLKNLDKEKQFYKKELKELIGHTPVEVIAGISLGIILALINFII